MLDELFKKQSTRARYRSTFFGPHLDDYLEDLRCGGYTRKVLRRNVSLITHFGEYAAAKGALDIGDVRREHIVAFLARERARFGRTSGRPARGASVAGYILDQFRRRLEARGVWRGEAPTAHCLMDDLCRSLAVERGLQPPGLREVVASAERLRAG